MRVPRMETISAPTRAQTDVDLTADTASNVKRLYGFVKYRREPMPKVSEEHKERRREEILAAAQRCFARYGYEGATVARLEEETGLSRGAIFNYFENKEALFVALVRRSSDRFVEIWLEQGYRALLEAVGHEDPEWLSVQVEAARRVRTDERFREQITRLLAETESTRESRYERLRGVTRGDVP